MAFNNHWSNWWRGVLAPPPDTKLKVIEILCQRYVDEMQRIERFNQYAEKMHYPQYRDKLLLMAQEKRHHAERIGEQLVALGGKLPDVAEIRPTEQNSWRSLSMALDEENRSADHLEEQLRSIQSEHADIVTFLQRISQAQQTHRVAIRDMLMRSDPFAHSLA